VRGRNCNDGDIEAVLFGDALQLPNVVNGDAAPGLVADLLVGGVKQGRNLETFLAESGVVSECKAEVAGPHDGDTQMTVKAQDLTQVTTEVLDVITDSANAEFAEIREVFANLRCVQVKLLRQRLRRDRLRAGGVELVQAPQINGQAVRRQFRHLVGRLPPLVRSIHKTKWYCKVQLVVGAHRFPVSRALAAIVTVFLLLALPAPASSQPAPRRLTTVAGLRQFPGYFHLQNVLLRGEFTEDGGRISLKSDDGTIGVVLDPGVRTSSGPVEVRAQLIDVGRLEPGDPRVPESQARDASRWPRPGEELILRVTAVAPATAPASVSVRTLALEPWRYEGQKVTVTGNFRGRNLFGDLPGAPGKSRYDFVIRGAEGAAWVTGVRPRGRGFDLDIDRRLDTDQWLEVTGVVAYERGLVRIDATELAAATPPQTLRQADEPASPPPLFPPLEVVFSSPTPGEIDVPSGSVVRVQFSRGIDARSVGGSIKVSYTGEGGMPPAFRTTYDAATRSLTLRFATPLERFRTVQIEVGETLRAFDGAPTKPWTLTFTVGE
jgi:hypothetical protein